VNARPGAQSGRSSVSARVSTTCSAIQDPAR
jgi:hypothetical protein